MGGAAAKAAATGLMKGCCKASAGVRRFSGSSVKQRSMNDSRALRLARSADVIEAPVAAEAVGPPLAPPTANVI